MAKSPHYYGQGPTYTTFTKQTITGNGVKTTFTLTYVSPSTPALLVVKNGLVLNPSVDYTLTGGGSQIVFTTAPLFTDVVFLVFTGQDAIQTSSSSVEVNSYTGDGAHTTYALTSTPYATANVIVFVDGILQAASTNYNVSGGNVVFTSNVDTGASIDLVHIRNFNSPTWLFVDNSVSSFDAQAGGKYIYEVPLAGGTLVLPDPASVGDEVAVVTVNANALSITSTHDINLSPSPYTATAAEKLVYSGSTYGWIRESN
jgi:hypothetical protein